ncbi:MAG: alpha/beta hydrolase [Candidatus Lokiarchaeota archaeon]
MKTCAFLSKVKYSEYFRKNIQNSNLEIIENAGHSVMIEKPNQVNKVIESYIKSHF